MGTDSEFLYYKEFGVCPHISSDPDSRSKYQLRAKLNDALEGRRGGS